MENSMENMSQGAAESGENGSSGLFRDIERHENSIYVLEQELRVLVPQHTHRQGHILYVPEGVATINVERSAYYIPNGYFVWIPPCVSHRVSFEGRSVRVLNIYFPAEMEMGEFHRHVGVYPTPPLLYHTIEMVQHTAAYAKGEWMYDLLATLHRVVPHLIAEDTVQLRLPTTDNPAVQRIVDVIQARFAEPVTAQEIADEVGMSVRTLSRYMRNEMDITFIQYLRNYRIMMAVKMIVKKEESVTNIAYAVGYESLTAFSNSFFLVTGYRPSQFLNHEH